MDESIRQKQKFLDLIESVKKSDPQFYEEYWDLISFFIEDIDKPGDINFEEITKLIAKGDRNHARTVYDSAVHNLAENLAEISPATVHEIMRKNLWKIDDWLQSSAKTRAPIKRCSVLLLFYTFYYRKAYYKFCAQALFQKII